ncbi:M28 family peptidase (plasmid) [Sorangium sp. So ce119]|uniref:M28 family metallopeptidase n=1 Tax=Sorangium sp. So ce119 TaxID=3133279 RepID=UPI003F5D5DBD
MPDMQAVVGELCSPRCAGRRPGTKEGAAARAVVVEALRAAGLDPYEQPVPGLAGANVLATLEGDTDRYTLVGAHFDHLGSLGQQVFWGADDNAAAVAILVDVARALAAARPAGRGVIVAAFDGEEPPHFLAGTMGSVHFAKSSPVPLDRIDMMVCMDLVGHALGPEGTPDEVRRSLIALGAERSAGTAAHVDAIARAEPGVIVRRADAEVIPPLSDYFAFWEREVPFLFLTCGRSRVYHTPEDTPEKLDFAKMEATSRWIERFVRETCARPEPRVPFLRGARDDASSLRLLVELAGALEELAPQARQGRRAAEALLAACDREGRLPEARRHEAQMLLGMIEAGLA